MGVRALVLEAINHLTVTEVKTPSAAPGEVLVRVVATGICGSDVHGFTGENGRRFPGQIMGHESAGRVAALGAGVAGPAVGTAVTFNPVVVAEAERKEFRGREQHAPSRYVIGVRPDVQAAFADYLVVPAENVVQLPEKMPVRHGALVEPLAVAVHAVRRAHVQPSDVVAVLGGGPIGQSVVLALRMAGVRRIAVSEVSPVRRDLVKALGAVALDPRFNPLAEQLPAVLGALADVAIDAVGVDATVAGALTGTREGGTVCLVGMGSTRLSLDAYRISTEERTIVGSFTYSDDDFRDAANWLATVPELADLMIDRLVEPSDAEAAFAKLASGADLSGKVLVNFESASREDYANAL